MGILFGLAVCSLLLVGIGYLKAFKENPRQEIDKLMTSFRATKSLSKKVQEQLKYYADNTSGGWDRQLFPGVTIRQYYSKIERTYESSLSEQLLQQALDVKPGKSELISMTGKLKTQYAELLKLHLEFDR
jgi:hypothetical protein